jgi:1,4-alpha-glucan branching enzyme
MTPIRFELLAPYNEDVKLLGSWNKWKPTPMQRGDDGCWYVEVPLKDGDYEYKYELISRSYFAQGKKVSVADPKALRHTHENTSLVTVRNGKRVDICYQWQHDDKPLPVNEQLVMYELHIGDFRGADGRGTFQSVIEKLDYLVDLGINAIEFMPVNEFPGEGWGYNQRSIYAVENSYGTPDDFCRLVDECHARGIRVFYDAVYNHMEADAPLTQIDYAYWFYEKNPDEAQLDFGPKFNYEHYDENLKTFPAREYVIGAMRQWIELFHIDGIRFDATRALKYYDLLDWFNTELHSRINFKPFFTIAEHVPQDPTVAGPEGPMDAAWHENYSKQMQCTIVGVPKDGRMPMATDEVLRLTDGRLDGFVSPYNTIKYIDNHDQDRIMWQLGAYGSVFDDPAFRRMKLGAGLLLTAPGIPMLYMGQEFGHSNPRSLEPQPLDWNLLNNERNSGLFQHYKHLIALRKTNPALYSDTYEIIANFPDRCIIGYKRWSGDGNIVIVMANLGMGYAGQFEVQHPGLDNGVWQEAIYNYEVKIEDNRLVDTLAESDLKIYIRKGN